MSAPTSAGVCSCCDRHVQKRYGGEGRYPVVCLDCWIAACRAEGLILASPPFAASVVGGQGTSQ